MNAPPPNIPPLSETPDARRPHAVWALGILVTIALGWVLYQFPPEQATFYPTCWFHRMTGWQCAGCGGLRAVHHLLHGRWALAAHYNMLVVAAVPGSIVLAAADSWLRRHPASRISKQAAPLGWALLLGFLLLFMVGRNVPRLLFSY